MANERETEDIVREHFKRDPLFDVIKLEEQKTTVSKAKKCLDKASKHNTGKAGYPEFIISIPAFPDDIIVIECKADRKHHESKNQYKPIEYAVDGVLHYAKFLSKEYNVFSIAVSGTEVDKKKVSSFYQEKGSGSIKKEDDKLLDVYSYLAKIRGEAVAQNIESGEITKLAIELNKDLNDYSIVEYERCTLVSAILLALQDDSFRKSYQSRARTQRLEPRPDRLAQAIVGSIKRVLEENDIDDSRVSTMISEYQTIQNKALSKELQIKKKRANAYDDNFVIRDITQKLEQKIIPLIRLGGKGYDVLGRFYTEFIRYAGTDKKTGLVLTPKHITEFFCEIVNLNENDVVFDSCCGTGGFLVSAMKHMLSLAGNDETRKNAIKQNQLIGIEKRTDMFTFACSNMMMCGDGKSNIYQGDSFSAGLRKNTKELKPTVAFLNPPYDVGEDGQLEFIENTLSYLEKGGRCVAIVQMSCVTSEKVSTVLVKERLLKKHTLKAVFSMPNDLFYPVGVVTCVMVFEAHNPHPASFKSYFGYYKEDGFVKTKHLGRIDNGDWLNIKEKWIGAYINRDSIVGSSIIHRVNHQNEWCAEAHMKTDYQVLSRLDFTNSIKDYVIYLFSSGFIENASSQALNQTACDFLINKVNRYEPLDYLFEVVYGVNLNLNKMSLIEDDNGIPFVSRTSENNGVTACVSIIKDIDYNSANTLSVSGGGSVLEVFLQEQPYYSGRDLYYIKPKKVMSRLEMLFYATIIKKNKYRYNYGRQANKTLKSLIIPVFDGKYITTFMKSLPYSSTLYSCSYISSKTTRG